MKRSWPDDYRLSERIIKKIMKYRFEVILFVTVTGIILSASYFTSSWVITSMFLAPFAGVFLSFVLQNSLRRKEARKTAAHALVTIWLELRHNKNIVEDIKKNFSFPEKGIAALSSITRKISNLQILASRLEDRSFYAGQQSRAFFEIQSDKVYNAVQTAYYNSKLMQTMLLTSKLSLSHFTLEVLSAQRERVDILKEYIEKSIKEHISKCEKEISISLRMTCGAVDELADTLKKYGVTPAEELRDVKLANKNGTNKKSTKI